MGMSSTLATQHHHYQDHLGGSGSVPHSQRARLSESTSVGSSHTDVVDNTATLEFVDDEKIMEESIATAPTQVSGHSHGGGDTHPGDDGNNNDDDDTTTIHSNDSLTGRGTSALTEEEDDDDPRDYLSGIMGGQSAPGAPATAPGSTCSVSTAPSTDEASSLGGMGDWANYSADSALRLKQQPYQQQHRRVPSWEVSPHNQFSLPPADRPSAVHLPPSFSPSSGWGGGVPHPQQQQQAPQQQHVANFRGEPQQQGYAAAGRGTWNHQQRHQTPPRYAAAGGDPALPFLPTSMSRGGEAPRAIYQRQNNSGSYAYHLQQQPPKRYTQPPLPRTAINTPPRAERGTRGQTRMQGTGQSPHRSQTSQQGSSVGGSATGNARSPPEILKTLLRKKACLYEPDTSRAVALVTWLVGRELALQYGFFSRQQLQAGVHACVAHKIESGAITRTKVNRCMQIILNSCFHYIIPRPDGTEESGDPFRGAFAREMKDDSFLLELLPAPWDDVQVDRPKILSASQEETVDPKNPKKTPFETPTSSPKLGSVQSQVNSPGKESTDGDGSDSKRAVLLCFNENVRSAEDVFRCHNEFIRDTAHACHLQLSSNEWRVFFGREAASAPYLWGNIGIPVPYLDGQGPPQTDALGVLTPDEASCLRTSWCTKRYDHDHGLCGFAHAEVNGGWLRRNPSLYTYKDELCQFVTTLTSTMVDGVKKATILNECPRGVNCEYAHSTEEIRYHPRHYKQNVCPSMGRPGGCQLGDVCPGFHPADSYRFPKKTDGRSPRHSRQGPHQGGRSDGGGKGPSVTTSQPPKGSPILYASPAPVSSFERQLVMPGLRDLFRRHASALRVGIRSGGACKYNHFGDDAELYSRQSGEQAKLGGPLAVRRPMMDSHSSKFQQS